MRIARGFFRLWVVLSVLWVGTIGTITWQNLLDSRQVKLVSSDDPPWDQPPPGSVEKTTLTRSENIRHGAELAVLPPLIVLAIGTAFGWTFRGFAKDR